MYVPLRTLQPCLKHMLQTYIPTCVVSHHTCNEIPKKTFRKMLYVATYISTLILLQYMLSPYIAYTRNDIYVLQGYVE